MSRIYHLITVLLLCLNLYSQDFAFCKYDSILKCVHIKWYPSDLFETSNYNVYRKLESEPWTKINPKPISTGKFYPSKSQLEADSYLAPNIKLVASKQAKDGLGKLSVLLHSFESLPLCNYMGHYFMDSTAVRGFNYTYKIERQDSKSSLVVAEVTLKNEKASNEIKNLNYRLEKNALIFFCTTEVNSFYGIKIYKKDRDSLVEHLITPVPILVNSNFSSEEQNKTSDFFKETITLDGSSYDYRFEAIDYFNDTYCLTKPMHVKLPDQKAPTAPASATAKAKGRIISYSWQSVEGNKDLAGFNIYRTTNNDTDFAKINALVIDRTIKTFQDSVTTFQSYMYKIVSVDKSGNESASEPKLIEVPDLEAPRKPENIRIKSDSGVITLSWDQNNEKDLWGYLIYRSINDTASGGFVKITPTPLSLNSYVDYLPSNAKNRFYYRVLAIDQNFNKSPYSQFASSRMPDMKSPKAPLITELKTKNNTVEISWLSNSENDLHHYTINRFERDTSQPAIKQLSISATSTFYVDKTVMVGKTYSYQLSATDSAGNVSGLSPKRELRLKAENSTLDKHELSASFHYQPQKKTLTLEWYPKLQSQLLGSVVYHRQSNESSLRPITGMIKENQFAATNLQTESITYYQIRTYYKNGEQELSVPIEIKINSKNKLKKK